MTRMDRYFFYPRRAGLALLLFVTPFFATAAPQAAKPSGGMDIVMVLDASGSMKKSDPLRMRVQAAKMFATLLDKRDRVALISFSGQAKRDTELLNLAFEKHEDKLLDAIDKINATGTHTNLHEALKESFELLQKYKPDNRERAVILMSDGQMDVGRHEKNLRLLERTLEELVPKFIDNKIKIYSIAFTDNSYVPLLKLAAEDTQGHFNFLKNAEAIHQVFESIFERSKKPDMLPIKQDSFIVDSDVNEITIVASKFKPDSFIALENPSGIDYDENTKQPNLRWFSGKQFDLITLIKPAPGYWLIKYSEGGNKAYVITDLKLEADLSKKHAETGTPLQIQAWLARKNERIKQRAILSNTQFSIDVTYPNGKHKKQKLADDGSEIGSEKQDGVYGGNLKFDVPGSYRIEISATSETFDRQKAVFLTVTGPEITDPFAVRDEEPAAVTPAQPTEKTTEKVEVKPAETPPNKPQHDEDTVTMPAKPIEHKTADDVVVPVHEEQSPKPMPLEDNKPIEVPPGEHADGEASKEIDYQLMIQATVGLVIFNVLLIGGIIYFYRKKKKGKKSGGIDLSKDIDDADDSITVSESVDDILPAETIEATETTELPEISEKPPE